MVMTLSTAIVGGMSSVRCATYFSGITLTRLAAITKAATDVCRCDQIRTCICWNRRCLGRHRQRSCVADHGGRLSIRTNGIVKATVTLTSTEPTATVEFGVDEIGFHQSIALTFSSNAPRWSVNPMFGLMELHIME
jgi:hypothetical protein